MYVPDAGEPGTLPAAIPIAGFDRVAGVVELLVDHRALTGEGALALARVGDRARMVGPLGTAFLADGRVPHLLVVADVDGLPRVRAAVHDAVASGRRVVLALEARSAADVYPSSLLPDEAEYAVATRDGSLGHPGDASDLVADYEAWADQCLAAGSAELISRLVVLARGRDARLGVARLGRRRGRRAPRADATRSRGRDWLQVAVAHRMGCLLGVCLGCVVPTRDGLVRACREGPVLAAGALRSDGDA